MNVNVDSSTTLGIIIRSVRRSAKVRIDDLAATAGVSKQFLSDLEHGKSSVQFGLVLKVLAELGVLLRADIPSASLAELSRLRATGLPPRKRQRREAAFKAGGR